jgi:hypothetical protein
MRDRDNHDGVAGYLAKDEHEGKPPDPNAAVFTEQAG